jgi:hypothetical protein
MTNLDQLSSRLVVPDDFLANSEVSARAYAESRDHDFAAEYDQHHRKRDGEPARGNFQ